MPYSVGLKQVSFKKQLQKLWNLRAKKKHWKQSSLYMLEKLNYNIEHTLPKTPPIITLISLVPYQLITKKKLKKASFADLAINIWTSGNLGNKKKNCYYWNRMAYELSISLYTQKLNPFCVYLSLAIYLWNVRWMWFIFQRFQKTPDI